MDPKAQISMPKKKIIHPLMASIPAHDEWLLVVHKCEQDKYCMKGSNPLTWIKGNTGNLLNATARMLSNLGNPLTIEHIFELIDISLKGVGRGHRLIKYDVPGRPEEHEVQVILHSGLFFNDSKLHSSKETSSLGDRQNPDEANLSLKKIAIKFKTEIADAKTDEEKIKFAFEYMKELRTIVPNLKDNFLVSCILLNKLFIEHSLPPIRMLERLDCFTWSGFFENEVKQARKDFTELQAQKTPSDKLAKLAVLNQIKKTPLHGALNEKDYSFFQLLLDAGADVNQKNQYNNTPLIIAAFRGDMEAVNLITQNSHCDLNQRGQLGRTAYFWAVNQGHTEIAALLLKRGADSSIKDNFGAVAHSGLERANSKNQNQKELVQHLKDLTQWFFNGECNVDFNSSFKGEIYYAGRHIQYFIDKLDSGDKDAFTTYLDIFSVLVLLKSKPLLYSSMLNFVAEKIKQVNLGKISASIPPNLEMTRYALADDQASKLLDTTLIHDITRFVEKCELFRSLSKLTGGTIQVEMIAGCLSVDVHDKRVIQFVLDNQEIIPLLFQYDKRMKLGSSALLQRMLELYPEFSEKLIDTVAGDTQALRALVPSGYELCKVLKIVGDQDAILIQAALKDEVACEVLFKDIEEISKIASSEARASIVKYFLKDMHNAKKILKSANHLIDLLNGYLEYKQDILDFVLQNDEIFISTLRDMRKDSYYILELIKVVGNQDAILIQAALKDEVACEVLFEEPFYIEQISKNASPEAKSKIVDSYFSNRTVTQKILSSSLHKKAFLNCCNDLDSLSKVLRSFENRKLLKEVQKLNPQSLSDQSRFTNISICYRQQDVVISFATKDKQSQRDLKRALARKGIVTYAIGLELEVIDLRLHQAALNVAAQLEPGYKSQIKKLDTNKMGPSLKNVPLWNQYSAIAPVNKIVKSISAYENCSAQTPIRNIFVSDDTDGNHSVSINFKHPAAMEEIRQRMSGMGYAPVVDSEKNCLSISSATAGRAGEFFKDLADIDLSVRLLLPELLPKFGHEVNPDKVDFTTYQVRVPNGRKHQLPVNRGGAVSLKDIFVMMEHYNLAPKKDIDETMFVKTKELDAVIRDMKFRSKNKQSASKRLKAKCSSVVKRMSIVADSIGNAFDDVIDIVLGVDEELGPVSSQSKFSSSRGGRKPYIPGYSSKRNPAKFKKATRQVHLHQNRHKDSKMTITVSSVEGGLVSANRAR